jgi:CDP-paratose 2-epimerase
MRILVTGGAGLVGSHCAEYFAQENKVIVLDNLMRSKLFGSNKESVEYNWRYLEKIGNIKLVKGDIRSIEDVANAVGNGVDVVIHCAGQPGVQLSIDNPIEDFSINTSGTLNVLELARRRNPNTINIFCSTNKVYGENVVEDKPVNEKKSIDHTGHTPYGVSKLAADLYVQEYSHIYGMKTGVFRMSCTYGTRQFGFEDQGWVAWFVIATLLGKPITIYGDGTQVRDMLYVDDLVQAFDLFIKSGKSGVYNIGGGNENTRSLLEFIEDIRVLTGKKPELTFKDWRASDQKVYISDTRKVKKALGWTPLISVRYGTEKLIKWVEENKEIL